MNAFQHSSTPHHPGQRFGNYRLIKPLGRGGFADVSLGKHVFLGTLAAVKTLHSELTTDDVQQFLAEARTAARLRHAHIVRVLDFGMEDDVPFLIMEYAPGGTLRKQYPHGTKLAFNDILTYVRQLARAVQYIHKNNLIHRDIKPENMLLGSNGELLLSDFGISIAPGTSEQIPVGTVAYMAPEQIEGVPCLASDQYSLAVVVYEWLTGTKPFQGTMGQIVQQHLYIAPPPLRVYAPDVPLAVEDVVLCALAKDPRQRFKSVQVFTVALQDAFEARPVALQEDGHRWSPTQPTRPFPPASRQEQVRIQGQKDMSQRSINKVGRESTRSRKRKGRDICKEIAVFYASDLLAVAIVGAVTAGLGAAPWLLQLLLALSMVSLPLTGAIVRKNVPLFFLTLSITGVAAVAGLLTHQLVVFDVSYLGLLILSLLIAVAISLSEG